MIIKPEWLNDDTIYTYKDVDFVVDTIREVCYYTQGKCKYMNIPAAFDTETTSFYDSNGQKTGIVYIWMFSLCGLVIVGRTWDEWILTYNKVVDLFRTCGNKRVLIVYVHDLRYDFQFLRKHHKFIKVFATEKYAPLYAQTEEGIEFRCSYRLSGYSLKEVGKRLNYHKVEKMTGDLDYRQIRHSGTPLTDKELKYCINDVKVVCAYIDECINMEEDITKIPLTKTGYVRRHVREVCFNSPFYKNMIKNLKVNKDDFEMARNAFQGGFTHGNADHIGTLLNNVTVRDIASSYPSVMLAEKYPMSEGKKVEVNKLSDFYNYCDSYCCIFTVVFINLKPRHWFDFYLSASKCEIHGKRTLSNGRIVCADFVRTTITNVDFDIIEYMYEIDYDNLIIENMYVYKRDYLPTPFIKSMLDMYKNKTELKGIPEKIIDYNRTKEMINSFYGMTVTNPIKPLNKYTDDWIEPEEMEIEAAIDSYNKSYNRFLFYLWGVYVTAYARHNIWDAIINCGYDHVYSDTDAEYYLNDEKHKQFFDEYNNKVMEKHRIACKVHGINYDEMCAPLTKDGIKKPLGFFEYEETYDKFKTLGAKRYLGLCGDKYKLTVAGLSKTGGLEYLKTHYENPFDGFDDKLAVPSAYSGRLIHTYIDEIREGDIIDMYGNKGHYKELSCINLDPSTYNLSMSWSFIQFVLGRKRSNIDSPKE